MDWLDTNTSLRDHNYHRHFEPGIDTDQCSSLHPAYHDSSAYICALDPGKDSFETVLVCLLRAYARNIGADNEEISSEALSTLSQDQLQSLVTSNSVQCDVTQQILYHKQQRDGGAFTTAGCDELHIHTPTGCNGGSGGGGGGGGGGGTEQPSFSGLSTEQLKEIQMQVNELIRNHQVHLPSDSGLEHQQMILHNFILSHFAQLQAQRRLGIEQFSSSASDTLPGGIPKAPVEGVVPPISPRVLPDMTSSAVGTNAALNVAMQNHPRNLTVGELTDMVGSSHAGPTRAATPATTGTAEKTRVLPAASSMKPQKKAVPSTNESYSTKGKRKKDSGELKKPPAPYNPTVLVPFRPPAPYNLYFSHVSPKVQEANPGISFGEMSKTVSAMWNNASPQEKLKYYAQHEQLMQAYQTALERQLDHIGAGSTDVNPSPPTTQFLPATTEVDEGKETREEEDSSETTGAQENGGSRCILEGCSNIAVFSEDRGYNFCSNECVAVHARLGFQAWVVQRKAKV